MVKVIRFNGFQILRLDDCCFGFKCSVCRVVATQRFFMFTPNYLGFMIQFDDFRIFFFKMGWLVQNHQRWETVWEGAHNECPHNHRTIAPTRSVSIAPSAKVSDAVLGLERQNAEGMEVPRREVMVNETARRPI